MVSHIFYPILKIAITAKKGTNEFSYVAVDELTFVQTDTCDFLPKEAWETTTSTTTLKPEDWFECTFQQGLCGWELSGAIDENMFYWNRTTGQELINLELPGPVVDHLDLKTGK